MRGCIPAQRPASPAAGAGPARGPGTACGQREGRVAWWAGKGGRGEQGWGALKRGNLQGSLSRHTLCCSLPRCVPCPLTLPAGPPGCPSAENACQVRPPKGPLLLRPLARAHPRAPPHLNPNLGLNPSTLLPHLRLSSSVMLLSAASAASWRRSSSVFWAAAGVPRAATTREASSSREIRPVMRSPGGVEGARGGGRVGLTAEHGACCSGACFFPTHTHAGVSTRWPCALPPTRPATRQPAHPGRPPAGTPPARSRW